MRIVTNRRGFSLIEAVTATALVAGTVMMAARWVTDAAKSGARSAGTSVAAVLASHKIEQLHALRWAVDELGVRRADLASDTAVDPPAPGGGLGLSLAPPGTLESDVPGYVDYVTPDARTVATRSGATYVRRWSIAPLPLAPDDGVLIEVCVVPVHVASVGEGGDPRRRPDVACEASIRTRGVR
jgi:hypothetical protein